MTVPASYEKLINDVEHELRNVDSNTSLDHPRHPLQTAGRVITRAVEWSTETLTTDELVAQKKRIEELEELCAAQQEQISGYSRAITREKQLVRNRDDMIANIRRQRNSDIASLKAGIAVLLRKLRIDSIEVTQEQIAQATRDSDVWLTVDFERSTAAYGLQPTTKTGDKQ